ncbi:MAG TPA: PKD domain-containing protein, partial [Lentimicrobium sp.]|nr:PKD domain-containing protein [Lentimicrobium sp.]
MRHFKFLILISVFIMLAQNINAQTKRANVWYFRYAGFDFNYGSPPIAIPALPLYNWAGTCSISDSNGIFLFCGDGERVLNKFGNIMQGGDYVGSNTWQGPIAFPMPENERFYYLFSYVYTGSIPNDFIYTLVYSVIDMQANNGVGKVCDSVLRNQLDAYLCTSITAIHHSDKKDVWVLAHQKNTNKIYAYLITPSGVTGPIISTAGDNAYFNYDTYSKLSPDGKWFVQKSTTEVNNVLRSKVQVLAFDNTTGIVSETGMFEIPLKINNHEHQSFEFSPDCSKLYIADLYRLDQYDMSAGTPEQILASKYSYDLDTSSALKFAEGYLQLGPDGKIYINAGEGVPGTGTSVIHKPNLSGAASDFRQNDLFMVDDDYSTFEQALPNFLTDWLKDPVIKSDQYCSNQPVNFSLELNGSIDSVFWDFNDFGNVPNDTSSLLTPSYKFSGPGTYHITAEIHFGNLLKVIPYDITIVKSPSPDLGPDTLFCLNDPISLTLDAGEGEQYNWNGNFTPGDNTFVVTDVGTYWVKVIDHGCIGRDTINVSRFTAATVDITNLDIAPSNCGQNNGAITGIVFTAPDPFTVTWLDAGGNLAGVGNDLLNVPAGGYTATVNYGNNCTDQFGPYSIADINAPTIANALPEDDHCNQGIGKVTITPETGNITDYQYSINGIDYFPLTGDIIGLTSNTYNITLKDQFGCISAQVSVEVLNVESPTVNSISTPETGSNGDGTITVISPGVNLTYQLEGGLPQTSSVFTGLSANTYYVIVTDEFGCATRDTVIVGNLQGSLLVALADNDRKCLYKPANSDIRIARVTGMKDLKAILYFNDNILHCTNFNANSAGFPGISAMLYTIPSRVELAWHGTSPVTSTDSLSLGSMLFETLLQGAADVSWEPNSSVTYFLNESGDTIQPILIPGTIIVHELPVIAIDTNLVVCEKDSLTLLPQITGGTDPLEYAWLTPTGTSPS